MWGVFCFACLVGCAIIQYMHTLPALIWGGVLGGVGGVASLIWGRLLYGLSVDTTQAFGRCLALQEKRGVVVALILPFVAGISLMSGYVLYRAHIRLADVLDKAHEGKVSHLRVRVNDIAQFGKSTITFDAQVLSAYGIATGIPRNLRVYWSLNPQLQLYQEKTVSEMPEVRPGQVWEMWLLLKPPNTLMNPGGFDNETYLFRENIRATATVKGKPVLRSDEQHSLYTRIQAWRHDLRQAMQTYVGSKRYGAVLIALVMGDQAGIAQEDWQLFNRTGMTHLVSISGSHITMLSALAMLVSMQVIRRIRYRGKLLAEYGDISLLAGWIGLLVALGYCLLAGWGIPAQRTFFMLFISYLLRWRGIRLSLPLVFLVIATLVSILDPWAMLSTGFYLSFAAVAVLQQLSIRLKQYSVSAPAPMQLRLVSFSHAIRILLLRGWLFLKEWCLLQGMITVAVVPFLIYFFHQVSLVSPLVNAYAIFLVGMVVTPLALLMGLLSGWGEDFPFLSTIVRYLADASHTVLQWVIELSDTLGAFSWASVEVSTIPTWVLGLGGIGIVLLLLPAGIPLRRYAILLLIPTLWFEDKPLQMGEWTLYVLDVGQGGAALVRTAHHTLLFDTGVRVSASNESGSRVLIPAFKALGIKKLDALVVSHSDLDHSGGLKTVLEHIPVQKVYASFQVDGFLRQEQMLLGESNTAINRLPEESQAAPATEKPYLARWLVPHSHEVCQQGVSFHFDGVVFRFLNQGPLTKNIAVKSSNAQSCVLSVEGKYHRALLTGDIGAEQEQWLVEQGAISSYEVVQVPHHGSLSSSSPLFVAHIHPLIAVAQTGFLNRFKHPHPLIRQRWLQQGGVFLNTAQTGAVEVRSQAMGIAYYRWRERQKHYWHRVIN